MIIVRRTNFITGETELVPLNTNTTSTTSNTVSTYEEMKEPIDNIIQEYWS